jgi:hypothetical protein
MINWKKAHIYKGFLLAAKLTDVGYAPVLLDEKGCSLPVSDVLPRCLKPFQTESEAIFNSRQAVEKIIIQRLQQKTV